MLRLVKEDELPIAMSIIDDAKMFLKHQQVNQWQNGYPNSKVLKEDIRKQQLYFFEKDRHIIGVVVLQIELEKTYKKIVNGKWGSNALYLTIHRLALSSQYRGSGHAKALCHDIEQCARQLHRYTLRLDTHPNNQIMQRLAQSWGFSYCGHIYLENEEDNLRYAFEKEITY